MSLERLSRLLFTKVSFCHVSTGVLHRSDTPQSFGQSFQSLLWVVRSNHLLDSLSTRASALRCSISQDVSGCLFLSRADCSEGGSNKTCSHKRLKIRPRLDPSTARCLLNLLQPPWAEMVMLGIKVMSHDFV